MPIDKTHAHSTWRQEIRGTKTPYRRYPKPPYSYLGLMVTAIYNSPDQQLSLSDICRTLENMFPFFKQEYRGWKDSVRHNLSHNTCFVKRLKDPAFPNKKGNFWAVDLDKVPHDAFKRQDTSVARESAFSIDLHTELNLPGIPVAKNDSATIQTSFGLEVPHSETFSQRKFGPSLAFSVENILKKDTVKKDSKSRLSTGSDTSASSDCNGNAQSPRFINSSDRSPLSNAKSNAPTGYPYPFHLIQNIMYPYTYAYPSPVSYQPILATLPTQQDLGHLSNAHALATSNYSNIYTKHSPVVSHALPRDRDEELGKIDFPSNNSLLTFADYALQHGHC
ncbi:unnamed protein product [Owenia fusiformis]|uniref:Uncharacterized protein n=2 Tax=Owenia fusiformis TaxID=6347 RepID=A0A8J1TU52_OWEFU|nr:unnamed protein product [Owenia fusiformis]